ncbi:soma ferritin-like isoform X1 [Macrobrachium nipponense]|uniref:soma ferritin-like isoform X1 n=1 Tax=Macrobrachium nipponense TaxID=159736 RepID=UPI0030C84CFB
MPSLYISLFATTAVLLVAAASGTKKDHYRFRSDQPTTEEDEDDDSGHHHRHRHDPYSGVAQVSRCRHNFNDRTEAGINRQINFYMHSGYVYNSMAHYFGRCDIALPGFQKFFEQMATEQRERTEALMKYQNMRGGEVNLQQVTAPTTNDWGTGIDAMIQALELEKTINQELLELHMVAMQHDDVHAASFIQTIFLAPQVEKIFTISQYITNLERVGPGLGEYMFDKLPQN